jgi:transposase
MAKLLKKLKFVYKKTKQVPGKANRENQENFKKMVYDNLKTKLGENDKIYFLDGSHPQHNSMPAYGWIEKGKDKEIKTNTGRKRININGALSVNKGIEVIAREDETINAQSTIKLLETIEEKNPNAENIYTIVDNAGYNRSKLVVEWLKKHPRITMIFLPPYSPNLNLIERLWKFLHKKVCYNKYYEHFADFKAQVMGFFDNIDQYQEELKTLLTENFQIIGTEIS